MNYSKKLEIFLANPTNKLDRIDSRGLTVLPAKPASQPHKHSNKIQCRYELQISAKANVNSNKNLLSFVSCCQSTSDQYSISRIVWNVILFLHVTARITNSPFFPLYSCSLEINSKTCGY